MANRDLTTKTIAVENDWTDPVEVNGERLTIRVGAPSGATVTLQCREPETDSWLDYPGGSFGAAAHKNLEDPGQRDYRIGIKTGQYGSAPVFVSLQKGRAVV